MRHFTILFVLIFVSCTAVAQTRGVIDCQSDYGVPVWEHPGSIVVVTQILCGRDVTILGVDRGYVKIRIDEHASGYVEAKYIRSSSDQAETAPTRPTGSRPPVDEAHGGPAAPARQSITSPLESTSLPKSRTRSIRESEYPPVEIFAGYSLFGWDTNEFLDGLQYLHGWNASVSASFTRNVAVEFDVSGNYKRYDLGDGDSALTHTYSFLAGPRFNHGPIYVHALIGGDILRLGGSQGGFAVAFGGGFQWPINESVSFRGGADYFQSHHDLLLGGWAWQNNIRVSAGVVFNIWKK